MTRVCIVIRDNGGADRVRGGGMPAVRFRCHFVTLLFCLRGDASRLWKKRETQLEKDSTGTDPLIHGFERTEFAEVARDRLIIQRLPLPLPGLRVSWENVKILSTFYHILRQVILLPLLMFEWQDEERNFSRFSNAKLICSLTFHRQNSEKSIYNEKIDSWICQYFHWK